MNYKEYDEKPKKRTHLEVFSLGVSKEWKRLFLIGLLFCLSLIGIVTFRFLVILHEGEMNLAVSNGTLTPQDAFYSVNSLKNMFYIASFLLVIPVCLILAGMAKTAKMLSWREPTPVFESFGEGMKENSLYFIALALINVAFLWCVNFVSSANPENPLWTYFPKAVYYLVAMPTTMWSISATAIYKGGFFMTVKNSFALTLKTYPLTIIMMCIVFAPLFLLLLSNVYLQFIVPFVFAVYLPFALFLWALFTNVFFDKYININQFPHLVDRGL